MATHNANNERIKRQYFAYLKEARRYSEETVDAVAKSLARFEAANKYRDFKAFHYEQAIAFKRHLAEQNSAVSGMKLSKATLHATLTHLKRFFQWVSMQPGFKAHVRFFGAEYFNLSENETRIATARRHKAFPTVEQVRHAIACMPAVSDIERRDRALVACTLLTGARDSALASMCLKHVDLVGNCIHQDAREVRTKFRKTFDTYFLPVGNDVRQIFAEWVTLLRRDKLWGNDDPLFPATEIVVGADRRFQVAGLKRVHWNSAAPIRTIFRHAFEAAGLPYFNPHSLRSTLAHLAETLCQSPEEFKAFSQNLGHEGVLTTFNSYGQVASHRQRELILNLGQQPRRQPEADEIAEAVFRRLNPQPGALPGAAT